MAVLKQIKFGNSTTPIAKTQVALAAEGNAAALSLQSANTAVTDDADPLYTLKLAVDGKTITGAVDGLATALKLTYHEAVTTEGSKKSAYIALEDIDGKSIANSEIPVSSIIGNGVLKSASYSETTGKLTLVFAKADGGEQTVEIDLGKLLDIDDIIIEQKTAKDYLSFGLADPASETGQAVLGVKLANVTYTASGDSTQANLEVSTTNGKMLDASDAIPAIKSYVLDVLESASTSLAVTAKGDDYVGARVDAATDNKHVIVATNVKDLTATAGTPGVYDADGQQTTAPVAGTLSGVADSLADGADIATKVKTYVEGAIAIEGARSDAKNKADIKAAIEGLDVTDTEVDSQYVSVVSETDGKVTVSRADVSAAKLNNYVKGSSEGPIAATDTINQAFSKIEVTIENNEETTSQALNDLKAKINDMNKSADAVNGQVVTTISETDGVVSETKANVKDLQLGGYSKTAAKGDIAATDTINTALSKLENAAAASSTTVAEGTDAGNNMTIAETTDATDGHKTYTINLTDVASKAALDAEIAARKAVDGQSGQTYAANSGTNYISEATSLNDADVKLDAAIKAVDNKIEALDLADTAVAGQVVVAVDEENGLVTPEKKNLSGITLAGFTADTTKEGAIADTDTVADALNKLQNKADAIQYKITGTTLEFFGMGVHA